MLTKLALFLIPFFVTLALTLWQHLRVFDTKILFIFDSGHYLYTASQVVTALTLLCTGRVSEGIAFVHTQEFVSSIRMLAYPFLDKYLFRLSFFHGFHRTILRL